MTTLPAVVSTERLTLPLWTADEAATIRAGRTRPGWHPDYPRQDDRDAAGLWAEGDTWGPRHIVRGATALGSIGFFGPPSPSTDPDDGVPETEVGYGLVEEARGWGFATEALGALLAVTDALGVRIRASVEPANKRSIRVLAKCGFTELRGADGEGHLVMARPLQGQAPGMSVRDRLRAEVTTARQTRDRAAVEQEVAELLAAAEVAPEAQATELREAAVELRRSLDPQVEP